MARIIDFNSPQGESSDNNISIKSGNFEFSGESREGDNLLQVHHEQKKEILALEAAVKLTAELKLKEKEAEIRAKEKEKDAKITVQLVQELTYSRMQLMLMRALTAIFVLTVVYLLTNQTFVVTAIQALKPHKL